jgi:recombination endonuclease VII
MSLASQQERFMQCVTQGCGKKVFAVGLCSACYARFRRRGTLEKKNGINRGKTCAAEGCTAPAFAKGLCGRHYQQADHPLKNIWRIIRSVNEAGYPVEWDDFDSFVRDVGERPTEQHQLKRRDVALPYSKENVYWFRCGDKEDRTKWDIMTRPEYVRAWTLERKYGISAAEYDRRMAEQGGKCAVCRQREKFINKRSGKTQELSVDHCHSGTGVRGLLCVGCNRGLGYFSDDPAALRAAADYIEKHRQAADKSLLSPAA